MLRRFSFQVAASSLLGLFVLLAASTAAAQTVYWTDWTSATASATEGEAAGTLTLLDGSTVEVSYTGDVTFANIDGEEPNYWIPEDPYISDDVPASPVAVMDIIAQSSGVEVVNTVTFSRPVEDALFAVVSLNNADHAFSLPIEVVSFGCGFWGCGELFIQDETTLGSSGEGHGVVRIPGVVTSFSFQHTVPEFWTGFTVGITGLAPVSTEPYSCLPATSSLLPAYPNPAPADRQGELIIPLIIYGTGEVRLALYDVLGREVAVLVEGTLPEGSHEAALDASRLAPGIYVVRLTTGGEAFTRQLTVVR